MSKVLAALIFFAIAAPPFFSASLPQGGAKRGPDASTIRDPDLERESLHNLDVARQYFKLKKAYRAALSRCEEIIAGNPSFSKMDEVLYIAGESSLLLSEHRGKQTAKLPVDKLREDARDYLSQLVTKFPGSPFSKQAETDATSLGGVKKKDQKELPAPKP